MISFGYYDWIPHRTNSRNSSWNPVITTETRQKSTSRTNLDDDEIKLPKHTSSFNFLPQEVADLTYRVYIERPDTIRQIDGRPVPTKCIISTIDLDRDGQKCSDHPQGCGKSLKEEELLYVDGRDNHFSGHLYYLGVYRVRYGEKMTCKVGVVKCQYDCVKYFQHRYCVVQSVHHGDEKYSDDNAVKRRQQESLPKRCRGAASAIFLDSMESL